MKITKQMLIAFHACKGQVELFEEIFPNGTSVTLRACRRAIKANLQLHWLADRVFDASAFKAYYEARASAQKAYDEARATAFKALDEAVASAQKAYDEALATAEKAYYEAVAQAFYNACKGMRK
jgi:hypothetical protein